VLGDAVEHAAGTDRWELVAVADCDQLRAGPLDQPGQGVQALVVDHPCLVQEDRRLRPDMEAALVGAVDESVERERASG
jgi:hypothetical protein